MDKKKHIFIIGAKSIGKYGGFETFAENLTELFKSRDDFELHIACKKSGQGSMDPHNVQGAKILSEYLFMYNNAECFLINIPEWMGAAQAIYYDIKSIDRVIEKVKNEKITDFIVYILACRIGPFFYSRVNKIHKLGGSVYINPDGNEWKRSKWSAIVRKYWKISEKLMVVNSDLVICDSKNINNYIRSAYKINNTVYISYGTSLKQSTVDNDEWNTFKKRYGISEGNYYLVISRFVPENNYETIIREFLKCNSMKDLVIICNKNNKLYNLLQKKYFFESDRRIKFIGTVYNTSLVRKIRECAFCYIHGHEVGGTNPSLLEALASTKLNILYDIGFNREVAENCALYWNKNSNNLCNLITECENLDKSVINRLGVNSKKRISEHYSLELMFSKYLKVFKGYV